MALLPWTLQEPGSSAGLLEALLEGCQGAQRGGGVFAWATTHGARLLLRDKTFSSFAEENVFEMVVGVDSITNEATLDLLAAETKRLPGLRVRVFLHESPRALFHPKFSWFASDDRLVLIVGSGNLTVGGFRANWEAFSVLTLTDAQARSAESNITDWLEQSSGQLRSPGDEDVRARAKENSGRESDIKHPVPKESSNESEPGDGVELLPAPGGVLVAEIPRAGDRWGQANLDLSSFEGFFGATVGTQRRIFLRHVGSDGTLAELESRPSVARKSQNYSFEIGAAAGLAYPPGVARPIVVFVKTPAGIFLYRLVMPSDSAHSSVDRFLSEHWVGRVDRMRRIMTSVGELRKAWPSAPLWSAVGADD